MLPKKRRISRKMFGEVFPKTKIFSTDFFTVRFLKKEDECETRFSIIVSKKVSSKAVKRNLAKRRISHAIKMMEKRIENSFVVLIFCKKTVLGIPFGVLQREIMETFERIKILKEV